MQRASLIHNPSATSDRSKNVAFSRHPQNTLLSPTQTQHPLVTLQPATGNQAALRLIQRQSPAASVLPGRRLSWDFSGIPLYPPERSAAAERAPLQAAPASPTIQPKLEVSAGDDPLEHEADRVANQVMRMPDQEVSVKSVPSPQLHRKCAECGKEDKAAQNLQMMAAAASKAPAGVAPSIVHDVLRSPGQSLDEPTRAYFEARLGHNLSRVRVHTDSRAVESANSLNALAYTVGNNVVFGFSATVDRKRLLAHELVHVLQQSSVSSPFLQRQAREEGESLPGGPGMERTVPGGTKQPPRANSPEAIREEAQHIGSLWGLRLADRDIALDTMQEKFGGASIWERMTAKDKQDFAREAKERFAKIPELPQLSKPELIEAQESGFVTGLQEQYSFEKLGAFLVKLGRDLAIAIFSGLAESGVKLPRLIAQALARAELAETAITARSIVARIVKAGQRVVVNIGGEGEVAGAINLNIQRRLKTEIENFIEADAANIGEIFDTTSIDEITSNRLPPNTLDWGRIIPGVSRVLKPGGRLVIRFQGVGQDGATIVPLLKQNGFKAINDFGGSGAVFEAVK
jgi:hypothetical protein